MNRRFRKIYYSIEDNPVVNKDNDYFRVWCHFLFQAEHEERDIIFDGKRMKLAPGMFITSIRQIADKCNCGYSKVYKSILPAFIKEGMAQQVKTPVSSIITLVNWTKWNNRQNYGNSSEPFLATESATGQEAPKSSNSPTYSDLVSKKATGLATAKNEKWQQIDIYIDNNIYIYIAKALKLKSPLSAQWLYKTFYDFTSKLEPQTKGKNQMPPANWKTNSNYALDCMDALDKLIRLDGYLPKEIPQVLRFILNDVRPHGFCFSKNVRSLHTIRQTWRNGKSKFDSAYSAWTDAQRKSE